MIAGLRHVSRRRVERLLWPGGRAAILLYHRVADEPSDPYGLCVTASQFEQHLQAVRTIGRPIALQNLVPAIRSGSVPEKAIAVTFDDGYLDNLKTALPLLEKYDVPATIFATTGPAGRDREFWWDELERMFLQPGRLPETLEIRIGDALHRWEIGADAVYSRTDVEEHRHWHLLSPDTPTVRHAALRALHSLIIPLAEIERTSVLDSLLTWAGYDAYDVRASHRTMTPAQMASVDAGGLVRIEAHTVSHSTLPAQTDKVQRTEVVASKRTLEQWLGRPVTGFAYPYGAYDDRAVDAVREAEFDFACSGIYRSVWPRSDLFLLPRMDFTSCDGDRLIELLRWQLC